LIASDAAAPDRFLVGLAVLTLLSAAAAAQPLLIVVDDAQCLDDVSADILAFVARRVYADSIALLFAMREPAGRPLPLAGLADLYLPGLPDRYARTLLDSVAEERLDDGVAARPVAETRENPLVLIEPPGELTEGHLSGGALQPEPLPVGSLLQRRSCGRSRPCRRTRRHCCWPLRIHPAIRGCCGGPPTAAVSRCAGS
jgi:hypothetical protein